MYKRAGRSPSTCADLPPGTWLIGRLACAGIQRRTQGGMLHSRLCWSSGRPVAAKGKTQLRLELRKAESGGRCEEGG